MARRPQRLDRPAQAEPATAEAGLWRLAMPAAIVWLIGFAVWFLTRPFSTGDGFHRFDLLLILPDVLREHFATDAGTLPSGWRYFPQRLDLIATAALIAAGMWGIGSLALRGVERAFRIGTAEVSPDESWPRVERLVFAFGTGIGLWSLVTLFCGVAGALSRPLFVLFLLAAPAVEALILFRERSRRHAREPASTEPAGRATWLAACLAMSAFLLATVLGSMLPPFDFDVKEYHLGGPKEWFLDGRIHFLPHNVYTSFPFLTEMLSLSAMVVRGDWFRGALAGQLVLAGFLPLTAATVFATARRVFGTRAGWIAAVVFATTPWIYQISVVAYAEGGLTFYLALSMLAVVRTIQVDHAERRIAPSVLLTGFFAGCAMACKYPGVVQVVLPVGAALMIACFRSRPARSDAAKGMVRVGTLYALGVVLAVGPWLAKNTLETGNPVYPLMWTVFGGRDWDADLNARWRSAHSPPEFTVTSLIEGGLRIAGTSDWQSLLVFAFAPLALLGLQRRAATGLWLYLGFLFFAWWALTHRIDRFWVPLLPVAAVLAGAGATWADDLPQRMRNVGNIRTLHGLWGPASYGCVIIGILLNLAFLQPQQPAGTGFLADLDAAANAARTRSVASLNAELPAGAKVLLVGDAEVFDATGPVAYNTVFDRSLFEEWTSSPVGGNDEREPRSADEIRRTFAEQGITHVYANWREILRYRSTYGISEFVNPDTFAALRQRGVLGEPRVVQTIPLDALQDQRLDAERWFPSLIRGYGDRRTFVATELYPVIAE